MTTQPMQPSNTVPVLKPRRARPDGVSSNVKQHVVILRDHSGSMIGHKMSEANAGTRALVRELGGVHNKDGFFVTVIEFDDFATPLHTGQPASQLMHRLSDSVIGGGTNIDAALQEAINSIDGFATNPTVGYHYLRPVTILFSDGQSAVQDRVIAELKEKSLVITAAYGSDADHAMLEKIATSPAHAYSCGADGDELRRFLARIGATITQSVLQGQSLDQTMARAAPI